jgi:hypothetical protein
MSTKLTARRRYLPRIVTAVSKFQDFSSGTVSESDIKAYVKSETFEDLIRAMKLYGLSLRAGEAPDEVSRKAEELTDSLNKSCGLYASKGSGNALSECLSTFDLYKAFIKL